MNLTDFNYNLPPDLIAQTPLEPRDSSRLLVYNKKADTVQHTVFNKLLDYLTPDDLLVFNNTKVLPARFYGIKNDTGAKVEILLEKRINLNEWHCLVRPFKRVKVGTVLEFSPSFSGTIIDKSLDGIARIFFKFSDTFESNLDAVATMPLPHYITHKLSNPSRYQTVYARVDGSSAAPTAGLHFTDTLLKSLNTAAIKTATVTLHVGLGTFRPVKMHDIKLHKMHSENYQISDTDAQIINNAIANKKRIIAVGTTTARVLETLANLYKDKLITATQGSTDIFIYPPYNFKIVNGLITNFHLPQSTLLMLVSALIGREKTMQLYNEAIQNQYRFFSFGDAMLLT